jgi:hypothetical protein
MKQFIERNVSNFEPTIQTKCRYTQRPEENEDLT